MTVKSSLLSSSGSEIRHVRKERITQSSVERLLENCFLTLTRQTDEIVRSFYNRTFVLITRGICQRKKTLPWKPKSPKKEKSRTQTN
jgi:hypothetical protein